MFLVITLLLATTTAVPVGSRVEMAVRSDDVWMDVLLGVAPRFGVSSKSSLPSPLEELSIAGHHRIIPPGQLVHIKIDLYRNATSVVDLKCVPEYAQYDTTSVGLTYVWHWAQGERDENSARIAGVVVALLASILLVRIAYLDNISDAPSTSTKQSTSS